jgi:ribosomal protein S18 acetylase RimI-like enzyme
MSAINAELVHIRTAFKDDHEAIVKLMNFSKFTNAFSSHMFSSDASYQKGWIRVAILDEEIVAATCVRHKVQEPKTVLYFLIVHPHLRDRKLGALMVEDMERETPHNCIKFNVSKENPDARKFYLRHGYKITSHTALQGLGWEMEKSW